MKNEMKTIHLLVTNDYIFVFDREQSVVYYLIENQSCEGVFEVDGQWLTFPFPFVHHQPLHIF